MVSVPVRTYMNIPPSQREIASGTQSECRLTFLAHASSPPAAGISSVPQVESARGRISSSARCVGSGGGRRDLFFFAHPLTQLVGEQMYSSVVVADIVSVTSETVSDVV